MCKKNIGLKRKFKISLKFFKFKFSSIVKSIIQTDNLNVTSASGIKNQGLGKFVALNIFFLSHFLVLF